MCDEETLVVGRVQRDPLPHAITITIVDSSGLDDTGTSLVASVEPQEMAEAGQEVLEVGDGTGRHLEGKCDTHKINSKKFDMSDEEVEDEEAEEEEEEEEEGEEEGLHCLVCNLALSMDQADQHVAFFKSVTTATNRKMPVLLGTLAGCTITSRKAHSDFVCRRCFNLLDRIDALEVEMKETKEEIVSKYQETVAVYGGRARRRKPTTVRKKDYVFPKIEPEDEAEQLVEADIDENFEPKVEDLMEEEQDRQEEDSQDDEWEPEFKRPRVKREQTEFGPPKRKRGRPRKDSYSRQKELFVGDTEGTNVSGERSNGLAALSSSRVCVHCEKQVPVEGQQQHQYSCPVCQVTCTFLHLPCHVQQHHSELLVSCGLCSLKFVSADSLSVHESSHSSGTHSCTHCSIKFGTAEEVANHQNLVHQAVEKDQFLCSVCNKTYFARSRYISHVVKCHRGCASVEGLAWGRRGYLKCCLCHKLFKKASAYLAHERTHRQYRCHLCYTSHVSWCLLQDHVLSHHLTQHVPSPSLNMHKEQELDSTGVCQHQPECLKSEECIKADFVCSECGLKFTTKGSLARHLRAHDKAGSTKPCQCEVCGKILSNKYSLATHMKTHSQNSSFKCNSCEKVFVTKYTLLDHMRRLHQDASEERNKVCRQCGRSFFTNAELNYHLKAHTGERPFQCTVCGETYLSSSTLRYHMQKHSNLMYFCRHCKAKFKNYVGWSAHMKRVHGVACVKSYLKEHGMVQAVVEKEALASYVLAEGQVRAGLGEAGVSRGDGQLAQGPAEELRVEEVCYPSSDLPPTTELETTTISSVAESVYSQTEDRTKVLLPEGWEIILSEDNQEPQTDDGKWSREQVEAPGPQAALGLAAEWAAAPGEQARVVVASWKDCIQY